MQSEAKAKALEQFTDYFVKNYPGPDTIIFNPYWHAPKIFAAAYSAITSALSDKQAVETFTREQMLAEVERRVERALAARSALFDVPAVEPVGEAGEMPGSNGGFTMAAFKAVDVPVGTKLYAHPPLPNRGEDSAKVERLRDALERISDGYGPNHLSAFCRNIAAEALAATRSGSATTQTGKEG